MAAALPIELRPLSAGAAVESGVGAAVDIEHLTATAPRIPRSAAKLTLDIVAIGEGDALDLAIETSADMTTWHEVIRKTYEDIGEASEIVVGKLKRFVRAAWTVTGEVTFRLAGTAHQLFCQPESLANEVISEFALHNVSYEKRLRACISASEEAESYVAAAFKTPLRVVPGVLGEKTGHLAAAKLFNHRGRDPEGPDAGVFAAAAEATAWLVRVSKGLKPPGLIDSTPERYEGAGHVAIARRPGRGWT